MLWVLYSKGELDEAKKYDMDSFYKDYMIFVKQQLEVLKKWSSEQVYNHCLLSHLKMASFLFAVY